MSQSSPRDKLGRKIFSDEQYEEQRANYLNQNKEEIDPRDVKGYYTRKVRYNVKSVNDFIVKLRKTAVCDKFLG